MNPISGDPHKVAAVAKDLQDAADTMRTAARRLAGLIGGEFKSEATTALSANAGDLATVMEHSATRYAGTGDALAAYAPVLAQAQHDVAKAIAMMGSTDVGAASRAAHVAEAEDLVIQHDPFANESDKTQSRSAAQRARTELEHQQATARTAQALYDNAVDTLNQAAKAAIHGIHDAEEMSKLNDSFWDDVDHFVHHELANALAIIHDVLSGLAKWCGIIGVVLSCLGLPEVGAIFLAVSAVASVLDFVVQAVRFVLGDINLAELLWSAAWTALSVIGAGGLKGIGEAAATFTARGLDLGVMMQLKYATPELGRLTLEIAGTMGEEVTDLSFNQVIEIDKEMGLDGNGILFSPDFHPGVHDDVTSLRGTGEGVNVDSIVGDHFGAHIPVSVHSAGSPTTGPIQGGPINVQGSVVGIQG